jgi:hypothetical protein
MAKTASVVLNYSLLLQPKRESKATDISSREPRMEVFKSLLPTQIKIWVACHIDIERAVVRRQVVFGEMYLSLGGSRE